MLLSPLLSPPQCISNPTFKKPAQGSRVCAVRPTLTFLQPHSSFTELLTDPVSDQCRGRSSKLGPWFSVSPDSSYWLLGAVGTGRAETWVLSQMQLLKSSKHRSLGTCNSVGTSANNVSSKQDVAELNSILRSTFTVHILVATPGDTNFLPTATSDVCAFIWVAFHGWEKLCAKPILFILFL